MADNGYYNSKDQDYGEFYSAFTTGPATAPVNTQNKAPGKTNRARPASASTAGAGGGLTTRSVKPVKVDKFGNVVNPWTETLKAYGSSPQVNERLTPNSGVDPVNRGGILPADLAAKGGMVVGNEVDAYGRRITVKANPAVAAAEAQGKGLIKPAWTNRSPMLPVGTMTDEVAAAYAAVEQGVPGAGKNLANLLADQAQAGNIGKSPVRGGGGIKIGSGGGGGGSVPAGQPVRIATGKTATSGQTYQQGSSGSGKPYTYQVQGDGSIKNMTTGRTTAPATRR